MMPLPDTDLGGMLRQHHEQPTQRMPEHLICTHDALTRLQRAASDAAASVQAAEDALLTLSNAPCPDGAAIREARAERDRHAAQAQHAQELLEHASISAEPVTRAVCGSTVTLEDERGAQLTVRFTPSPVLRLWQDGLRQATLSSPLGAALQGREAGEEFTVQREGKSLRYRTLEVGA